VARAERAGVPGGASLRFTRKREALFEWTAVADEAGTDDRPEV
jgi:hypothetical protein